MSLFGSSSLGNQPHCRLMLVLLSVEQQWTFSLFFVLNRSCERIILFSFPPHLFPSSRSKVSEALSHWWLARSSDDCNHFSWRTVQPPRVHVFVFVFRLSISVFVLGAGLMWSALPLPGDDCSHFADQRSHRPSQPDPFPTPSLPIWDFQFNDSSTNPQLVSFSCSSSSIAIKALPHLQCTEHRGPAEWTSEKECCTKRIKASYNCSFIQQLPTSFLILSTTIIKSLPAFVQ